VARETSPPQELHSLGSSALRPSPSFPWTTHNVVDGSAPVSPQQNRTDLDWTELTACNASTTSGAWSRVAGVINRTKFKLNRFGGFGV